MTTERAIDKLIAVAMEEVGYIEKATNKDLDSKIGNAGSNNYTKYARDIYPSLQGQAWCDMFVDWCFVKAFGRINAEQMIGGFSAYTPTSASYYKNAGQWRTFPCVGDQVFFRTEPRISHTGIVYKVDDNYVYTIEGNTSNSAILVTNGGCVCTKKYKLDDWCIAGYGEPLYDVVCGPGIGGEDVDTPTPKYVKGWHHDNNGWWYADSTSTYYHDCWQNINGHRYYFNKDGYAVTNWQQIDGLWFYFEPRAGHPLECALYVTDENGAQDVGEFK